MSRLHLILWTLLLAPAPAIAQGPPLQLEWCTGSSPASWGFGVTPSEDCRQIHVRTRSAAVLLSDAKAGPGMPAGWTVQRIDDREAVASGAEPVTAGTKLETLLILQTNRSTGAIDARGALPVEWGIWFADAAGAVTSSGKMEASFPPVLPLAEAAARGMVLVTHEGIGPAGPIELTVDNPTWYPLWLDVPTGTVLTGDGRDWVIASCAPFRMMRKQKTGRTVTAFPLAPSASTVTPRRLQWSKGPVPEGVASSRALSVAADRLQDLAKAGTRPPGGAFERANPWDFWPAALRWATWTAQGAPSRDLLVAQVTKLIADRAAAGDPASKGLDPAAASTEVEAAAAAIAAEAALLPAGPLPLDLLAAKERFR
jgi:hypothetical protein